MVNMIFGCFCFYRRSRSINYFTKSLGKPTLFSCIYCLFVAISPYHCCASCRGAAESIRTTCQFGLLLMLDCSFVARLRFQFLHFCPGFSVQSFYRVIWLLTPHFLTTFYTFRLLQCPVLYKSLFLSEPAISVYINLSSVSRAFSLYICLTISTLDMHRSASRDRYHQTTWRELSRYVTVPS